MKKYVIWLQKNEKKVYYLLRNGVSCCVDTPSEATHFPNRFIASNIVKALKPAIKKNGLAVDIGFELLCDHKSSDSDEVSK